MLFYVQGAIDLKDEKNAGLFEDCDGIVFVIDAQNELSEVKEAVNTMLLAVDKAHRFDTNLKSPLVFHIHWMDVANVLPGDISLPFPDLT